MKTLRSLFALFVVVAVIYVGWKVGPVYFANYQLEDAMDDTARFGAVTPNRTEDDMREAVLKEARSLEVPLTAEHVHVQRQGFEVYIWGEYTVHVDLPLHPLDLNFEPASKSKKRAM